MTDEPLPTLPDADQLPYRHPAYAAFTPALTGDPDRDRVLFEVLDAALDAVDVPQRAPARRGTWFREHVAGLGPMTTVAILTVFIPMITAGLATDKSDNWPLLYTIFVSTALNVPSPLAWAMRRMDRMIDRKN